MEDKPFIFINCAMSIDGKISTHERRQVKISNKRDMERVDRLRASADAILVGMNTAVEDDPRLTVKSEKLRKERVERSMPENPIKVTLGRVDRLNLDSEFMTHGNARVILFASEDSDALKIEELKNSAEIFLLPGERPEPEKVVKVLASLGVRRLMIEGGGRINFEFLKAGLVDEFYVAIAPKLFGGKNAPTLADGEGFQEGKEVRLELIGEEKLDEILVLRYRVK